MGARAFFAALLVTSALGAEPLRIARPRYQAMQPGPFSLIRDAATAPACSDASGKPTACDPTTMLKVQYFGGKVIPNAKVYAVFWTSAVDTATKTGIGGFYQAVTNSEWMDWLTEYSTTGGSNQIVGRGTFAGTFTITPSTVPHSPCAANSNGTTPTGTCIWDTDIPTELEGQINAFHLPPPDQHTIYMFHFPSTYLIQSKDRAIISDSCVQYCAFHSTYSRTGFGSVYYGVMPDLGANGCDLGCGVGAVFNNLCSAASHELGEAITDAEVGLATTNGPPLGWYDGATVSQGEIGDMCNQSTDSVTSLGTGTSYTVQNLFSRSIWNAAPLPTTLACVATRFATNDYDVYFNPNTLSVVPGGAASVPVHLDTTAGANSTVTLSMSTLSALPSGVHASLSKTLVTSGAPGGAAVANLNVAVDSGTALATDQLVVVNATSGSLIHSASVLVQVTAAVNDWSLSVSPSSGVLLPGGQVAYTVSAAVVAGNAESISLATSDVTGLPAGVTATSFNPASIVPGSTTSTLTLSAASGAAATIGAVAFTIKGKSASQAAGHMQTAHVTVDGLPSVSITAPQNNATVSGTVAITFIRSAGTNSALASTVVRIDGVVYNGPLNWDTTSVASGSHTIDVTVVDSDGGSASAPQVTVTVAVLDFTLALSPAQGVATAGGGSASYTVTTAFTGAAETIALSTSGLPASVVAVFAPSANVTAGSSATLTLSAPVGTASTAASTFTVQGTSNSRPAGHTATAKLVVIQPPQTSLIAPAAGAVLTGTVTVTAQATVDVNTVIASVDLLDGTNSIGSAAVSPFSVQWDTTQVANGSHTLTAKVTDGAGNVVTSAPLGVTVKVTTSGAASGGCSSAGGGGFELFGALALALALKRRRSPVP